MSAILHLLSVFLAMVNITEMFALTFQNVFRYKCTNVGDTWVFLNTLAAACLVMKLTDLDSMLIFNYQYIFLLKFFSGSWLQIVIVRLRTKKIVFSKKDVHRPPSKKVVFQSAPGVYLFWCLASIWRWNCSKIRQITLSRFAENVL